MIAIPTLLAIPAARYVIAGVGVAVIAGVGFGVWLWRHDAKVADRVVLGIEQKAEEHVKTADDVRDAVAVGARGVRDPYRRDRHAEE